MADAALPMDIIATEILPKLPAKSLLRFKCVCKFFRTLISTPEFVHRHLRRTLSSDTNRLLILIGKVRGLYAFHLDSPEFSAVSLRFPSGVHEGSGGGLYFIGSCNGLVCIGTPFSSLIIFNPSTGIYKEIEKIDGRNLFVPGSCINYGFGFDDANDDYKIVRVMTRYSYDHHGMRREVSVYSMKSDSWSLIESTSYQDSMKHMENGALVDNHLVHWKFWSPSDNEHRIGCFDLRNNGWCDDVPLPDYNPQNGSREAVYFADILFQAYRNKENDLVHLGVLDGCLCLLTEQTHMIGVDVWVMKEYGVQESWAKLVGISNKDVSRPLKICPFAYGKGSRSEILVRVDSQSRFFWYNIRDKTWRWAEISRVPSYAEACICNGSLVSIARGTSFQIGAQRN